MAPRAASEGEIIALVQDRYRGRTYPGHIYLTVKEDGSWTARPENYLGRDLIHFQAAVLQVQRIHFVLTN